jgi:hypothetical protein
MYAFLLHQPQPQFSIDSLFDFFGSGLCRLAEIILLLEQVTLDLAFLEQLEIPF